MLACDETGRPIRVQRWTSRYTHHSRLGIFTTPRHNSGHDEDLSSVTVKCSKAQQGKLAFPIYLLVGSHAERDTIMTASGNYEILPARPGDRDWVVQRVGTMTESVGSRRIVLVRWMRILDGMRDYSLAGHIRPHLHYFLVSMKRDMILSTKSSRLKP